jgi:UDP-2,3-diacylglucosamine pyrophosphatase LpxH
MDKILVVSDIHLGSPVLRVEELFNLLNEKWSQIIVNGDLLDSGKFHRYNKHHWKILSKLRKLSKHIPVHLVMGNHDRDAEILSEILGLEYKKELILEIKDRRVLLVHGDQFDTFIGKHPFIAEWAGNFYFLLQRLKLSKSICRRIKESSKSWLNVSETIANRAITYIADKDFTDIIIGHSHKAGQKRVAGKNYWNSGTFCDDPAHYIIIKEKTGEIEIFSL